MVSRRTDPAVADCGLPLGLVQSEAPSTTAVMAPEFVDLESYCPSVAAVVEHGGRNIADHPGTSVDAHGHRETSGVHLDWAYS